MFEELDLLTLRATARRLRVPSEWLCAEVEAGRLPALRAGTELLFHFPTIVKSLADRAAQEWPGRADAEGVRGA